MSKRTTIVFVGADTGGHVVPAFALAREFIEKTNFRIIVVGVGTETEKRFYSKIPQAKYKKIVAGKFQFRSISNIGAFLKTGVGFLQSLFLLIGSRPSAIFLKGNYSTVPVAYAARVLGVPVFAHESDAVIGKSNRLIAKFAKKMFLSYPLSTYDYKNSNGVYSGPIIRPEIQSEKTADYQIFGFVSRLKTVLVVGGSQGSHSINEAVFQGLEKLLSNYQVIHQTGENDFKTAKIRKSSLDNEFSNRYFVSAFIDDVDKAIATADLVVSRASSTVFELASLSKAAILIPYPYASLDHQAANAKFFEENNAAVVIEDKNLSPAILYSAISKILSTDKKKSEMEENIKNSAKLDGRETIYKYLIDFLRK